MSPTLDAALRSWPSGPWLLASLLLTACIYVRGWRVLRRRDPARWQPGQVWAFLGGLGVLYLALASPIEAFADLLLSCHMAQHLLLLMAVPPLLWLSAPAFPLLRGLPEPIRSVWFAPLFRSATLARFLARATHPMVAVLVLTVTTWIWHVPAAYELVLRGARLALRAAWMLPRRGSAILVSRGSALPEPAALVALAAHSVPAPGGHPEHGPLRAVDPRKAGNMDCTFCLDCIHACPHDNLGLLAAAVGCDLTRDVPRSGVGRFAPAQPGGAGATAGIRRLCERRGHGRADRRDGAAHPVAPGA